MVNDQDDSLIKPASYLLKISEINGIHRRLLFHRFYNNCEPNLKIYMSTSIKILSRMVKFSWKASELKITPVLTILQNIRKIGFLFGTPFIMFITSIKIK